MSKRVTATPVVGTCRRTGTVYHFPSAAAAGREGFNEAKVRDCIRGKSKHHGGLFWRALGPMREAIKESRPVVAGRLHNSGLDNQQVADKMGITRNTANVYLSQARNMGIIK